METRAESETYRNHLRSRILDWVVYIVIAAAFAAASIYEFAHTAPDAKESLLWTPFLGFTALVFGVYGGSIGAGPEYKGTYGTAA